MLPRSSPFLEVWISSSFVSQDTHATSQPAEEERMIVSQTENQKAAATLSPTQAHDPHVGCSLRAPGPFATGRYEASLSALSLGAVSLLPWKAS